MTEPTQAASTAPGPQGRGGALDVRVHGSALRGRGWLNTGGVDLTLEDLRGKIVLLDFWTFCCVNCLHVLDELRPLEEKYSQELVVVGVHSPKFEFEKDPVALEANIERYEVHHPVLDDPELLTWSEYGARAWPTLMLLDSHGRIAANLSGEGHAANLDALIGRLVAEAEADGSLRRGPAPTVLADRIPQTLRFPSKVAALPDGRLVVSDAGQHRLVVFGADGTTVEETIGSGRRGGQDGEAEEASFSEPNGVLALPESVADEVGYDLLVADSAGHRLRGVELGRSRLLRGRTPTLVRTVAGTGEQWMQGQPLPTGRGSALEVALSTPWDLTWSHVLDRAVIAMAGIHQMWTFDPRTGALAVLGGTTNEGLVDGALVRSWWAQPSGVAEMADGTLVVADSETSAIRLIDPVAFTVRTVVGEGLFDFGHVDGPAERARLQHPLGVAALPDGRIAVADTYNGAIRLIDLGREDGAAEEPAPAPVDPSAAPGRITGAIRALSLPGLGGDAADAAPAAAASSAAGSSATAAADASGTPSADDGRAWETADPSAVAASSGDGAPSQPRRVGTVVTVATDLKEPSGLIVGAPIDGIGQLIVVESGAHRLTWVPVAKAAERVIDNGQQRTARPVTDVGPGPLTISVLFTPPAGHKLDESMGPSTQVTISTTPSAMIHEGGGLRTNLSRVIDLDPQYTEGVLHVSARAASCDADPSVEFPACHMHQQDWGVPIRIVDGAPTSLDLSLLG